MKKSKSGPSYRRQKSPTGDRAFVQIGRRRVYLGEYDTPESRSAYARLLNEWTASGERLPTESAGLAVSQVLERFVAHAETYYRFPDGRPTGWAANFRSIVRFWRELYGRSPASEFGPGALRALRERFIREGWSRRMVNRGVGLVRQVYKWAASHELIPVEAYQRLTTVEPLRAGRCSAHETEPVKPVPQEWVDAVIPRVSRQVAALIRLQLLTAARAGELTIMRAVDLDMSGAVWTFKPQAHKTAWHGHERTIYVGPRAQGIVQEFLAGRAVDAFLFSPREAESERYAACKTHRRQAVEPAETDRELGSHYTTDSFRRAIHRACDEARIPRWGVHRLRHNAATMLRKEFGLESARIILGHKSAAITTLYAELDEGKAIEVIRKIG